jgi:hypothetical protein
MGEKSQFWGKSAIQLKALVKGRQRESIRPLFYGKIWEGEGLVGIRVEGGEEYVGGGGER